MLGFQFLDQREHGVEEDHEQHRDANHSVADRERKGRCRPQEQRQRVGELRQQLGGPSQAAMPTQLVAAKLKKPPLRLAR